MVFRLFSDKQAEYYTLTDQSSVPTWISSATTKDEKTNNQIIPKLTEFHETVVKTFHAQKSHVLGHVLSLVFAPAGFTSRNFHSELECLSFIHEDPSVTTEMLEKLIISNDIHNQANTLLEQSLATCDPKIPKFLVEDQSCQVFSSTFVGEFMHAVKSRISSLSYSDYEKVPT